MLLTTVRGRQALGTVEAVILDEIHSWVENWRGVQLMVGLERLLELAGEFQRVAWSATRCGGLRGPLEIKLRAIFPVPRSSLACELSEIEGSPMKRRDFETVSFACAFALVLFVQSGAVAQQYQETAWAQPQQAALAEDILSGDQDRYERAYTVAEALGPARMSEDVRVALITRLERFLEEQDAASAQGIPLEQVVNGEFLVIFADFVATLNDPRAIPVLARTGDYMWSRYVAEGLASFGEEALPAILDVIDAPGASYYAVSQNVLALAMMVEGAGANGLSASARDEIVRVAEDSLRSQSGMTILSAVDLAVALNEPTLVQTVRTIADDPDAHITLGVSQSELDDTVRRHAAKALATSSNER